jgi:hypothetical protein
MREEVAGMRSIMMWTVMLAGVAWAATESLPCAPFALRPDPPGITVERSLPTALELGLSESPEAPFITR